MSLNSSRNPKRNTILCLGITILLLVILSGCDAAQSPAPQLEITPAQARLEIQKGAMILDVREASEYNAGHIAGAVLIPLGELGSHLKELPKDRLIIVQCRTGGRSAQGRDLLLKNGFTNATSLKGGILAWQAAGYPIETGALK